ncbi:SIS domain-containing protein [Cetobacterium somerae]|uniref:SIS domain-containing protein n=1 Tax=Cetobacterium somerae TaxID=188913 RepID=UPI00211F3C88|nr:SIS domain-containing protein [Cetobacterium somerae]MCQ9627914.1 SIS domain-containing protein [Cetobacterium somerae]
MVKMINCIDRIPETIHHILKNSETNFKELREHLKIQKNIDEIIFVASGSSFNSAFVSKGFIEKITGIKVTLIYPNNFINYTHIFNKNGLYIFISQGGGTKLVYESILKLKEMGIKSVSLTSDLDSKISCISDIKLDMGCGYEEIIFRTVGYSSSLLICYLIGLNIALVYDKIDRKGYKNYLDKIKKIPSNILEIINSTQIWYNINKKNMLENKKWIFIGADDLWGTAQEADIKVIETATYMTKSLELEEAIHGPQNGYKNDMNIFILLDKTKDLDKAKSIARFCKEEVGNCFIFGDFKLDETDFYFDSVGEEFKPLEYITPFQVLCHLLAEDLNRDITKPIYTSLTKYINKTL